MFSKDLFCRHVKTRACLGKGKKLGMFGKAKNPMITSSTITQSIQQVISLPGDKYLKEQKILRVKEKIRFAFISIFFFSLGDLNRCLS